MEKKISKRMAIVGVTALMIGLAFGSASNATNAQDSYILKTNQLNRGYTNITAQEAWDYANDTSNGIQIPIDVRTDMEWKEEFIGTPVPEHPRHFCLDFLKVNETLMQFMDTYDGYDIIVYCKGGFRSFQATQILLDIGFTGEIYNMVGGITAWNSEGLPTFSGGYLNITVNEAFELLTDTANGLQTPIDVRTDGEWKPEHIDTPEPEDPIHFRLDRIQDPAGIAEFLETFNLKEVIVYCKGGYRSWLATRELLDNNFTGTICNMIGGITAWNNEGLPTIADAPPTVEIINPKEGYFHFSGIPLVPTVLNLLSDTASLGGFRLNPMMVDATDDYNEKEDLTVKFYLNGEERGEGEYHNCTQYHELKWTGWALGEYNLTVTAFDAYDGNTTASMTVWNFCFIP